MSPHAFAEISLLCMAMEGPALLSSHDRVVFWTGAYALPFLSVRPHPPSGGQLPLTAILIPRES